MSPSLLRVLTSARERDAYPMSLSAYWNLYQRFLPRGVWGVTADKPTHTL